MQTLLVRIVLVHGWAPVSAAQRVLLYKLASVFRARYAPAFPPYAPGTSRGPNFTAPGAGTRSSPRDLLVGSWSGVFGGWVGDATLVSILGIHYDYSHHRN